MLIVLLIISLIIGGIIVSYDDEAIIGAILIVLIPIIFLIININTIVGGRVVDQKIDMYIEENIRIENQIETAVAQYMDYESETLKDLKGESAIALISLYPELKSDELIKTQIETYQANNAKIKELKESKIDVSKAKWWVYFGK